MNQNQQRIAALGFFDGVHRGHQAILRLACDVARDKGIPSAAITFREHPRTITQGKSPQLITPYDVRIDLMARQEVEEVIVLPFDYAMAATTAEKFVRLLIESYGVVAVVCGENFRFGSHVTGNPRIIAGLGLEVYPCPSIREGGEIISSTAIRNLVAEGQVEQAATLLGRFFFLQGRVEGGNQMGRRMGFPTANTAIAAGQLLPARGVYATTVYAEGEEYPAVTNVGFRPTFAGGETITVESHLVGFEGQLYDKDCRVAFRQFLRPERTFADPQTLAAQIAEDIKQAKETCHKDM